MKLNKKFICRICGNNNNNKPYVAREMMLGLRDEFLYYECSECKCLQIAEFPENISKYYPSDYYSYRKPKTGSFKKVADKIFSFRIKAGILPGPHVAGINLPEPLQFKNTAFLKGTVKNLDDRILDVGCGNGEKFLLPLHRAGFRNIAGCDPYFDEGSAGSGGPKIYSCELSEMKGQWDVITFNHSFEHLANPLETLQKANSLLAEGGCCIIRIPTVSSFAWLYYGVNWFQLDAPRHFFLHSVHSIKLLAGKSNFKLANLSYDSTHHQFTISERYKQGKTMRERSYSTTPGRIVHAVRKLVYAVKAHRLNKKNIGDQAIFYLLKE